MGGIGIALLVILMLVYLAIIGLGIAGYVMSSLGIYTIAKRRQISNPWLAWLPFANYWIIGSIAGDYDARNGIKRKWNKVLLLLSLVGIGAFIVIYLAIIIFAIYIAIRFGNTAEPPVETMVIPLVVLYLTFFAVILFMVAFQFCYYVCIFKIFESTVPEKALKYFLISLLVPLGLSVCLLSCRNKGYSNPAVIPAWMYQGNISGGTPSASAELTETKSIEETEENT